MKTSEFLINFDELCFLVSDYKTTALVQLMAWRQTGDKPLSEPMMVYVADTYMRYSASMRYASIGLDQLTIKCS